MKKIIMLSSFVLVCTLFSGVGFAQTTSTYWVSDESQYVDAVILHDDPVTLVALKKGNTDGDYSVLALTVDQTGILSQETVFEITGMQSPAPFMYGSGETVVISYDANNRIVAFRDNAVIATPPFVRPAALYGWTPYVTSFDITGWNILADGFNQSLERVTNLYTYTSNGLEQSLPVSTEHSVYATFADPVAGYSLFQRSIAGQEQTFTQVQMNTLFAIEYTSPSITLVDEGFINFDAIDATHAVVTDGHAVAFLRFSENAIDTVVGNSFQQPLSGILDIFDICGGYAPQRNSFAFASAANKGDPGWSFRGLLFSEVSPGVSGSHDAFFEIPDFYKVLGISLHDSRWFILGLKNYDDHQLVLATISTTMAHAESEVVDFTVFPNPAIDKISISGLSEDVSLITVRDLTGKVLISTPAYAKEIVLDIAALPAGCYIVTVGTASKKIIK